MESDKENGCFEPPGITAPPGGQLKQRLDAIFAEVTNNLPSIDFEFSDVSSEEGEVTVFQPAVRCVIATSDSQTGVSVDDASVDMEDETQYEDRLDHILSQIPTRSVSNQATLTDASVGVTKETRKSSVGDMEKEMDTSASDAMDREVEGICASRRHSSNRASVLWPRRTPRRQSEDSAKAIASRFMPVEPPTLTMKNIDLDQLLNTVGGSSEDDVTSDCAFLEPEQVKTTSVIDAGQGDGLSLIEKLAQMSLSANERKLHDIDPLTGAMQRKTKSGTELKKHKTAENLCKAGKKVSCAGTNTKDLPSLSAELVYTPPKPAEERETIYIDLRGFQNKKPTKPEGFDSVRRILQITQESVSDESSEEEDDAEMWHEQRKRIKESLKTTGALPPEFQKPPAAKSQKVPPPAAVRRPHPRVSDRQRHMIPPTREGDRAEAGEHGREEEEEERRGEGCVGRGRETTQQELTAAEEERLRRREELRRQQAARERQHQSRVRLGRQLEAMRPTTASSGRPATLEATPTLFDTEVSYEPAPESLPPHLPSDQETVLLMVHLSSNAEITAHKPGGGTGRSVDNRSSLSASYTALLTWLLSLVPDHFSVPRAPSAPEPVNGPQAPFEVVGLQQLFLDDQLCLFVAVSPTLDAAEVSAKMKKSKTKDDLTPFQKVLTKFLATNSLHTVCPWLDDLVSQDISADHGSTEQSTFIYRPPLPKTTNRPLSTFVQVNPGVEAAGRVLSLPVGFFWQVLDSDDTAFVQSDTDDAIDNDTQTTMSLVYKKVYRDPRAMTGILNRVLQEGLNLAGIRLLFPRPEVINATHTDRDVLSNVGPILAMAVRGTFARTIWLDAIGPSDPALARITDPTSLCALYGGQSREECLLFAPRSPMRVMAELCRWFGGRVPASGVVDTGRRKEAVKRSRKDAQVTADLPGHVPPATLTAALPTDVFLMLSPLVPARCTGLLLATAQRRGYQLRGFRQLRLTGKKCSGLGLVGDQTEVFCGCGGTGQTDTPDSDRGCVDPGELYRVPLDRPCMVMLLRKENALHHIASLIEAFMVQLSLNNMLTAVQTKCSRPLTSSLLFHAVNFSESTLNALGGDLAQVPNVDLGSTPGYIAPKLYTNPELEEFVILTFTGHERLKNFGQLLGRLQNMLPYSKTQSSTSVSEGFEVLGLKWLPSLNSQQARQLTPFEVGDKDWKSSVHALTSEPAVLLLLRGVDAFRRIRSFIAGLHVGQHHAAGKHHTPLDCLMAPTPDITYQLAVLFFHKRELYPDPPTRGLLPYLPPHATTHISTNKTKRSPGPRPDHEQMTAREPSVFESMLRGPRPLCTLLLVKPDAVRQGLSKLFKRLSHEGFAVVALRLETLTDTLAHRLIPPTDLQDEESCRSHVSHMTCGPCLLLSVQRENAVKKLLDLLGPEDPKVARVKNCGYWRAIFGQNSVANGLYGSVSYATAVDEQKLFFPGGLCCKETEDLKLDAITCQAVDSIANKIDSQRRHLVTATDTNNQGHDNSSNNSSSSNSSGISDSVTCNGSSTCTELRVTSSALGCLTQTTCVVLTPTLLQPPGGRGKQPPYVDIMDALLKNRFLLVGCRMLWLTRHQAEDCLHLYEAGSFSMVPQLTSGPSIVLALQRDNAIVLFDTLLGSIYDKESLYFKYHSLIMRSKDTKQASQQLCFFFDKLSPNSHSQIVVAE